MSEHTKHVLETVIGAVVALGFVVLLLAICA